ncbi:ElaD/SseL family deubiquitinase [Kalamiella sp. sgz302252]|uniref:ElaD/SseL family deubiquitinase n=1 Tax=Pantoea sp. sgz302252 TaxID=3341827 RepID=UPI0036D38B82
MTTIAVTTRANKPYRIVLPEKTPAEVKFPLKEKLVNVSNRSEGFKKTYFPDDPDNKWLNLMKRIQPKDIDNLASKLKPALRDLKQSGAVTAYEKWGFVRNKVMEQAKPTRRAPAIPQKANVSEPTRRAPELPSQARQSVRKRPASPLSTPAKIVKKDPGQQGDADKIYNLTTAQFESLFNNTADFSTLALLKASAAAGNEDALDLLHNLALRQDSVGNWAETALFALFSGKTPGKEGLAEEIQQTTRILYQLTANGNESGKFQQPSRLLYIAGSAEDDAARRKALTQIFIGNQQAQSPYEQIGDNDLWAANRMLNSDELYASSRLFEVRNKNISVNYPIPLIDGNGRNMLSEQLIEKMVTANGDAFGKVECFPVNTGNHWLLVALYKESALAPVNKAVVFNSLGSLSPGVSNAIQQALSLAGVKPESVTTIDRPLQSRVPNGCGVFVNEAIGVIAEHHTDPAAALDQFVSDFSERREPEKFNTERRRQIYEHVLRQNTRNRRSMR